MRKNSGITLIALVITIIVLLILAGISIATLMGENGILNQADSAKAETQSAEEEEILKLIYNSAKIRKEAKQGDDANKEFSDLLIEEANKYKEEYNLTIQNVGDSLSVDFADSKNSYKIDDNGNITEDTTSTSALTLSSYFGKPNEWGDADGTITQTADGFVADITNTGSYIAGDTMWMIQAYYDYVKCEPGTYNVSFKVSTDKLRHIEFKAATETKDGQELFPLTEMTIWPDTNPAYSYDVTIPEGTTRMSLIFALGAWTGDDPLNTTNKITISDLTITKK